MTIEINDNKTLEEISNYFTRYYPFLKIEFYHHTHRNQESSSDLDIHPKNLTIGEVTNIHFNGSIKLHYWQKTGVVEQQFRNKAGLNIQIFRKHGDAWIQTMGTDALSLEEQNEAGMAATEDILHGTNRVFEREKKL